MAGDHQCPVCQATFTRPQHVARHMRSHTGDRPYKCQHCSDQFARSDLLNRHINKCHPDHKSAPKDPGSKRKTSAVNRATTSKQACDQCVQSSLSCDGANPCAKCLQRKTQCTFVKFHRQTAPVGPGHPAPASFHASNNPYLPPPATADDLLIPGLPNQFAFNPPHYYPPQYPNQFADNVRFGRSVSVDFGHNRPNFDFADLSRPGTSALSSWEGSPDMGALQSANWNSVRERPFYASEESGSEAASSARSSSAHLPLDLDFESLSRQQPQQAQIPQQYHFPQTNGNPTLASDPPRPSSSHFHSAFGLMSLDDPHIEGLTPFFADLGPPPAVSNFDKGAILESDRSTSSSTEAQWPGAADSLHTGFTPGQPLLTPREAETRELREFWRQYMRTPLTGPNSSQTTLSQNSAQQPQQPALATPTPGNSGSAPPLTPLGQPSISGRRQRVNSLPTAKTPTAELYGANGGNNYGWYINGGRHNGGNFAHRPGQPHLQPPPPPSKDDLRSYEAAVMARKVSTALTLPAARNVGTGASLTMKRPGSSELANAFGQQNQPKLKFAPPSTSPSKKRDGGLRPSFKRNASQALGPEETKRARGNEDDSDGYADEEDENNDEPDSEDEHDLRVNTHMMRAVVA